MSFVDVGQGKGEDSPGEWKFDGRHPTVMALQAVAYYRYSVRSSAPWISTLGIQEASLAGAMNCQEEPATARSLGEE